MMILGVPPLKWGKGDCELVMFKLAYKFLI